MREWESVMGQMSVNKWGRRMARERERENEGIERA
jgi:hypothetical protein